MYCRNAAVIIVVILFLTGMVMADDDANYRLTVLIEMNWTQGDMYRTYYGTADIYFQQSDQHDSAYVEYVENYRNLYGEYARVPEFLGAAQGSGELEIEGSGSSGGVSMTFQGTADIQVDGAVIIQDSLGQVLDVTLSGNTDEIWTVHNPDGSTITMPQNHPMTPRHLVFKYGGDEIEMTEPWDQGTSREVFSLVLMNDPYSSP